MSLGEPEVEMKLIIAALLTLMLFASSTATNAGTEESLLRST
jgi:hypothetical protein